MSERNIRAVLLPLLALLCSAGMAFDIQAAEEKQAEAGFVQLFNGKNLEGWTTAGNWVPEDGVLALKPRPGETGWTRYESYLWTERPYHDFVLSLEYKHPKDGNSGVFFRVGDIKNPVDTGIEVQILDSHGVTRELTHHDCGGVIRTAAPTKNMANPAGEWNKMVITSKGDQLQVELNGEQIIDVNLADSPVKDRPLAGYIGLQDHGEPIWFRNIQIKKLD